MKLLNKWYSSDFLHVKGKINILSPGTLGGKDEEKRRRKNKQGLIQKEEENRNENLDYLQEFKELVCLALGWYNFQD